MCHFIWVVFILDFHVIIAWNWNFSKWNTLFRWEKNVFLSLAATSPIIILLKCDFIIYDNDKFIYLLFLQNEIAKLRNWKLARFISIHLKMCGHLMPVEVKVQYTQQNNTELQFMWILIEYIDWFCHCAWSILYLNVVQSMNRWMNEWYTQTHFPYELAMIWSNYCCYCLSFMFNWMKR